jgi:hypothetical protein
MATAKSEIFAITINDDAIGGIVPVDLERGAPPGQDVAPIGERAGGISWAIN